MGKTKKVVVKPGYTTKSGYHEVITHQAGKASITEKHKKWDDAMESGGRRAKSMGIKPSITAYDYDEEDGAKKGTYNAWGGRTGMGMPAYSKGSSLAKELKGTGLTKAQIRKLGL